MTAERQMEAYLSSLRANLGPITLKEREEILREIETHIVDACQERGVTLDEVLMRLGPADELASEYRDGMLIRRAGGSYSPLILLRGALRLASRGLSGLVVFFVGLFGYLIGGGLVLSAMLKPVFPANTGLWIRGGHLVSSGTVFPAPAGAHEVLGSWYIVIALTLGSLLLLATMSLIRTTLRVSKWAHIRLE
jgi:uncharacterized membrane protein